MDSKARTIATYNDSAEALAKKFDSLGARADNIRQVFALVKKSDPAVLEVGCGNGRDAEEIAKHTDNYLGIDISEKLLELAREKVPAAKFELADIENYSFPSGLDIIFAFASLIHVPRESLSLIISEALAALNPGGVFKISLKYSPEYTESTKEDEFGVRTYYLYSQKDVEKLAAGFNILENKVHNLRGQDWLEIILRKPQP